MNPKQRKTVIFAAIIVLTVLCGYLFFHKANKIKYAQKFNFHPDSVLAFDWNIGDQKFHFSRKSRNQEWEPTVDHELINRKLMPLGTLAVVKMGAPKSGLEVAVNFGGENQWSGIYSGEKFAWTEGNLVGQGVLTSHNITRQFEEGQWAFIPHTWNWCQSRPQKIDVEWPEHEVHVSQKKFAWFIKREKGETPLDATRMEKWLAKACQAKVDFFQDLKNFPHSFILSGGSMKIEFQGGQKVNYPFSDGYFKIDDGKAVYSTELLMNLQELPLIPK